MSTRGLHRPGWCSAQIKDLPIQIIDGDRSSRYPKQHEFVRDGILFLNTTNITNNRLDLSEANYVTRSKYDEIKKGRLQPLDIVMTTRGSIGKVALFNCSHTTGLINAQMLILRADGQLLDPRFLFYVTCSNSFQTKVRNFASGSAQPQIPITDLSDVDITYPPIRAQRKVAAILGAYDDLIENNLQRIKILERMAQVLYREWFFKFCFPGHERVRMVDSRLGKIPKRWEVRNLGELCELRKDKYREDQHSDLPLLDLAKMLQRTLAVGEMGSPEELSTSRILFDEDDILFGSIRPYLHKVALAPCRGVTNVSVLVIRSAEAGLRALLAVLLCSEDAIRWADQHSTGTKMPVIKWEIFQKMPVLMPEPTILQRFEEIVHPELRTIKMGSSRNRNLRRTRDLILPKLISGELDVSELDIAVPEEGA